MSYVPKVGDVVNIRWFNGEFSGDTYLIEKEDDECFYLRRILSRLHENELHLVLDFSKSMRHATLELDEKYYYDLKMEEIVNV
jgi:hypothetical protein